MLPKVIHYCWFGRNPLSQSAIACIESWKKYFPDYEIKRWDEDTFDIHVCSYVEEAYAAGKWAFVSDYARFWILYHYGGLYFDTDVEVIKGFDDICARGPFMGCEYAKKHNSEQTNGVVVNPGLGIGAHPKMKIYNEVLEYYKGIHFDEMNMITVCRYTTDIFMKYGFAGEREIHCIEGISIYPPEYFSPMNYVTGETNITDQTHSIHHYASTWHTEREMKYEKQLKRLESKFGTKIAHNVLFRLYGNIYCYGLGKTIRKIVSKAKR